MDVILLSNPLPSENQIFVYIKNYVTSLLGLSTTKANQFKTIMDSVYNNLGEILIPWKFDFTFPDPQIKLHQFDTTEMRMVRLSTNDGKEQLHIFARWARSVPGPYGGWQPRNPYNPGTSSWLHIAHFKYENGQLSCLNDQLPDESGVVPTGCITLRAAVACNELEKIWIFLPRCHATEVGGWFTGAFHYVTYQNGKYERHKMFTYNTGSNLGSNLINLFSDAIIYGSKLYVFYTKVGDSNIWFDVLEDLSDDRSWRGGESLNTTNLASDIKFKVLEFDKSLYLVYNATDGVRYKTLKGETWSNDCPFIYNDPNYKLALKLTPYNGISNNPYAVIKNNLVILLHDNNEYFHIMRKFDGSNWSYMWNFPSSPPYGYGQGPHTVHSISWKIQNMFEFNDTLYYLFEGKTTYPDRTIYPKYLVRQSDDLNLHPSIVKTLPDSEVDSIDGNCILSSIIDGKLLVAFPTAAGWASHKFYEADLSITHVGNLGTYGVEWQVMPSYELHSPRGEGCGAEFLLDITTRSTFQCHLYVAGKGDGNSTSTEKNIHTRHIVDKCSYIGPLILILAASWNVQDLQGQIPNLMTGNWQTCNRGATEVYNSVHVLDIGDFSKSPIPDDQNHLCGKTLNEVTQDLNWPNQPRTNPDNGPITNGKTVTIETTSWSNEGFELFVEIGFSLGAGASLTAAIGATISSIIRTDLSYSLKVGRFYTIDGKSNHFVYSNKPSFDFENDHPIFWGRLDEPNPPIIEFVYPDAADKVYGREDITINIDWSRTRDTGVGIWEYYLKLEKLDTFSHNYSTVIDWLPRFLDEEDDVSLRLKTEYNLDRSDFSNGIYRVTIKAVDRDGNIGYGSINFRIDTQGPQFTINEPIIEQNGNVRIQWELDSSENVNEVANYQILIDNQGDYLNPQANTEVYLSFNDGPHTVWVKAWDIFGNQAIKSITFLVDTQAPIIIINNPSNSILFDTDITIDWTDSHDSLNLHQTVSGIKEFKIRIDKQTEDDSWIDKNLITTHPATLAIGNHIIEIKAIDNVENESVVELNIIVDLDPPIVNILSPNPEMTEVFTSPDVTVEWECLDEKSGIDFYQIRIDSSNPDDSWLNIDKEETSYQLIGLSLGSHTVEFKAVDVKGRVSEVKIVTFECNMPPPFMSSHYKVTFDEILPDSITCFWPSVDYATKYRLYVNGIQYPDSDTVFTKIDGEIGVVVSPLQSDSLYNFQFEAGDDFNRWTEKSQSNWQSTAIEGLAPSGSQVTAYKLP